MTASKTSGPRFLPADRADCCGVQALVEVTLPGAPEPLWLCGHHYRRHAAALHERGAQVTADDQRFLTRPYEGTPA